MVTIQIFVLLVFSAASSLANAKRESFWGQGVFPDDREWLTVYRKKHVVDSEKEAIEKNYRVCETPECKKVAEEFLTSINKSVNPCDDFYEFTCGAWTDKKIPADSAFWSRFMIFDNTVKNRIKSALETPPERNDILPVRQAKKWYRSCMNMELLEQRGLGPIESILMQNGGWPISIDEEEWDSAEHSWQNVESHYARLTGSYSLFRIQTKPAEGDSEFGYVGITRPKLVLTDQLPTNYRNYAGNDYNAYVRLVESAAVLFMEHNFANVSKERLSKEAREIVEFEKEIYQLQSNMRWDDHHVHFEDLAEWCENITEANTDPKAKINLESMIENIFDTVNIEIDPETEIHIWNPKYIKKLSDLLARTPERTIVNYIHWTFVGNMLMYTTEQVRNELLTFMWQQFGVKERHPRWLECVIDMKMIHAAAYVFVDKYFTNTTEHAAVKMIKNIRKELREKIETSNWLDDESKIIAKDKVDTMKVLLGFPTWYKNRTAVINYYKGITIGADYFENVLSFIRYENKKILKRYASWEEPDEPWLIDPITVNALYGPEENTLDLPAVDFQAPLFTRQFPDAVNYGVAGVIVGHEMGHGFDNDGIEFGKNGDRTELSEQILRSYFQRAECFSDQYEEYFRKVKESEVVTVKSEIPPEILAQVTMGENIADTTGIQAVFQAFKKLDDQGRNLRLPGFEEYTPEQLFFISFAAVWCKVETPQFEIKRRETFDPHSPAKLRVIGSVSNTKDFATVFNCPKGSPMNPSDKCNIWQKSESNSEDKKSSMRRDDYFWVTQWKD